jgi:catechol 2,3-dioxygenase-like lactoylglutathione lyase family enzyme
MKIVRELMEVIIYAQDMNRLVAFYGNILGFEVTYPKGLDDYGAQPWVTLSTGACVLALHGGGAGRIGPDAPKIVFRVDDIEAAHQALTEKGVPLGEIRVAAPGVMVIDGADPEGNKLSFESHQ